MSELTQRISGAEPCAENIATGGTIHQMNVAYEKSASSGDFQFGAFMQNSYVAAATRLWTAMTAMPAAMPAPEARAALPWALCRHSASLGVG